MIEKLGKLVRKIIKVAGHKRVQISLILISCLLPVVGLFVAVFFCAAVQDKYTPIYKWFRNDDQRVGYAALAVLLGLASAFHFIRMICS